MSLKLIANCLLLFVCLFIAENSYSQITAFNGVILDYDSHEPVAGVTIALDKKNRAISDTTGNFKIMLPPGSYRFTLSSLNYHKLSAVYSAPLNNVITFYLKRLPLNELQEVTVASRAKDAAVTDVQMSTIRINPAQIKRTPLVFGESDLVRALTMQPGVVTNGETVSGYNVRGGNADQNLVLVDGAPLYNIAHLLGFYTGVSSDAVQDLTFYKAGIPAEYGSRLSSIMLLNIKTGNPDTMRFNTGLGPVSTHIFMNGPIIKNKLTIMAGGRIAYPKLLMNLFPDGNNIKNSDAFYYDDVLKLSYTPNLNNRISFSFYNSYDRYKFPGDTSYKWKNYVGSLQWMSNISRKLSLHVIADVSKYQSYINGLDKTNPFQIISGVEQKEGKATFNYTYKEDQTLSFGADFIHYNIQPGELKPGSSTTAITSKKIEPENANEIAAFVSTENKLTKFLTIQAGLRATTYNYLGPKHVFTYADNEPKTTESIIDTTFYENNKSIQNYKGFESRLLMRFLLSNSASVKISYNKLYQYLHLITNSTSITPVDYWKLSDNNIKPQQAEQYALGLFKNFKNNTYETAIEGYYKTTKNAVDYKNGADLSLNPALETQLLPAKGYAYGVEFSVKKNTGTITGMASYTYSRSYTKVITPFVQELVNKGAYYPANSDKPHNLVLNGSVKMGKGWIFASNFVVTSGRTATFPDGSYIINGTVVTNYSSRNENRLPLYHRLDISFSYDNRRFPQQRRYSEVNFSFYNVYAHKNVYSVFFQRDADQLKAFQLSVIGTIIPSISWNYNF